VVEGSRNINRSPVKSKVVGSSNCMEHSINIARISVALGLKEVVGQED
jgi:hypothetical protein